MLPLTAPSGAGKSTVAKRIAKDLSIIYVDTGAMYRCIGLYALRQGLDTKDSQQVSSCLEQIHLETSYDVQNGQRIFLNGEDVSEAIRTPDASMAASNVSAISQVLRISARSSAGYGKETKPCHGWQRYRYSCYPGR